MKTSILSFLFLAFTFFSSTQTFATPTGLTFQGRLAKDGTAVSGSVTLTLTVTSPNSDLCTLFEETHTFTIPSSDSGVFSVAIGSGTRTVNDKGFSITNVFSNTGTVINALTCSGSPATSYTPLSTHSRYVYLNFNTTVGTVAFTDPYVVQSVPYALEAEKLAGKTSSEYLQTTADTTQNKINALMVAAPYTELLALIGGTSTQYMTPGSAISTSGNITQSGATTLTTGTGGISLNGATTLAANQNFSMSSGTGTFAQTYTGTGTAHTLAANSVTTSAAQSIAANGLTSGNILSLTSNSTAAASGNKGLDIAISGANGTASITRTGLSSVVTSTGATSTNVGGYFSASGATTNYGLIVANGNVGVGTTTPAELLNVYAGNIRVDNQSKIVHLGVNSDYVANGAYPGIWFNTATPTVSNYAFLLDTGVATAFNSPTGTNLSFRINNSTKMQIDSATGNVGIGTVSPGQQLSISKNMLLPSATGATTGNLFFNGDTSAGVNGLRLFSDDLNGGGFIDVKGSDAGKGLVFRVDTADGGTERMRITSGGNVGIGTAAPAVALDVLTSVGNGVAVRDSVFGYRTVVTPGKIYLNTPGSLSYFLDSSILSIGWAGSANITTVGGSLTIAPNGGSHLLLQPTAGYVGIGTTSPGAKLDVTDAGTTTSAIIVPRAGNFTGTTANGMIRYNTASTLFEFYQNGAWVNYTTVSDGRLKTNVVPVTEGLSIVNQLNPVFYDWDRSNPKASSFEDRHQVGFIAQEVEKVLPEVVNKGEDSYRSLEYGKIVSVVVAAVKELYAKVMGLDEKIQAQDREIASVKAENAQLRANDEAKTKEISEMKARLDKLEKALTSK